MGYVWCVFQTKIRNKFSVQGVMQDYKEPPLSLSGASLIKSQYYEEHISPPPYPGTVVGLSGGDEDGDGVAVVQRDALGAAWGASYATGGLKKKHQCNCRDGGTQGVGERETHAGRPRKKAVSFTGYSRQLGPRPLLCLRTDGSKIEPACQCHCFPLVSHSLKKNQRKMAMRCQFMNLESSPRRWGAEQATHFITKLY